MQLWMLNDSGQWDAHPLTATHYLVRHADGRLACVPEASAWQALLYPWQDEGHPASYLLLGHPGAAVRLNGQHPLSLSLLQDRDEITMERTAVYFTTETLPAVVPFPGSAETLLCARCKSPLVAGELAVQCPNCRLWYHQHDTRPCWTYHTQCVCGHPTHGDFVWRPEPVL
jgi:hypothetical protein